MARMQKRWSGAYRLRITWMGADQFQGPYAELTTAKAQRSRILNDNKYRRNEATVVIQEIPGEWQDITE